MKILYVHHGNRKINNPPTQDDDLTELGEQDAKIVAELLAQAKGKENIKAIYTSRFFRCKKTADIINTHIQVPIFIDERFDENGSVLDESWTDCQTRTTNAIKEIIQKYDNNDFVICVTSGVNIASFISLVYNLSPSENTPFLGVPNCCPIIFNYDKSKF